MKKKSKFGIVLAVLLLIVGGAAAFLVAVALALKGKSLLIVSLGSSAAVLVAEFLLKSIF